MSNEQLKTYLTDFLGELGPKRGGGRYTYDDIVRGRGGISKSTLFNWLRGAPAKEEKLTQLAKAMVQLAQRAHQATPEVKSRDEAAIVQALEALTRGVGATLPPIRLFRFAPICGHPDSPEWSFLGEIVRSFLPSSRLADQGGSADESDDLSLGEATVHDQDFDTDRAILAGCFATPDRSPEWAYIRTPVSLPVNAIYLERDLAALLRRRPPDDGRQSVAEYNKALSAALWKHYSGAPSNAPKVRRDLMPITYTEEAGRKHMLHIHRFESEDLESNEPENSTPEAFLSRLLRASEKLQEATSSTVVEDDLKLPLAVLDELTALKVLKLFEKNDLAKATAAQMPPNPAEELFDLRQVYRPRFAITLAIRRDQPAATSSSPYSFEATKRSWEEFLFSNSGAVAHVYVRLYCELVDQFGRFLGDTAPLHFLKWLSIEIGPTEVGCDKDNVSSSGLASALNNAELWAWHDILHAAKLMILHNSGLKAGVRRAFEVRRQMLIEYGLLGDVVKSS